MAPPTRWTKERVIHAAHLWRERYGKPPSSGDWLSTSKRYNRARHQGGEFPAYASVVRACGSWTKFIAMAGMTPHCTNPYCGRARPYARTGGECKRCREHRRITGHQWLPAGVRKAEQKAALAALLRAWAEEHGRSPRARDWEKAEDGHPTWHVVRRQFGSWNNGLRAAGLSLAKPGGQG